MPVDVTTEIDIERPIGEVSSYAADPANAPQWYANIVSVEWKTQPKLEVGAKVAFVARFFGKTLAYTYEIIEYLPGERLVMSAAEGPFPMTTTYIWSEIEEGGTHMTLRNNGEPAGFSKIAAPFMRGAMRRANKKDLSKIKDLLESRRGEG